MPSPVAMKKEYPKDFDIVWVCIDCSTPSLYHSDIEEHKSQNDRHNVAEFHLDTGRILVDYAQ
jgi:hypothetical protein